ncbi:MAG TPA: hypothetical protein PLE43_03580 [Alphaproteobacteria bacterium]|nr:hypothetical protein [Alphaproteobacteria bacterium]
MTDQCETSVRDILDAYKKNDISFGDATRTSATRLHEAMKNNEGPNKLSDVELAKKAGLNEKEFSAVKKGLNSLGNRISKMACEVTGGISSEIGDRLTVSPDTIKNVGLLLRETVNDITGRIPNKIDQRYETARNIDSTPTSGGPAPM